MDRNREARRATMAATNGLTRRRHRSSSLRDSPEEDGPVELQETARLRDRGGSGKKDRDRDRDRERDRERDRDRDRLSRSKRRRGDRLLHGNNREDGGDESSEESVNDEEEDEDDEVVIGGGNGGGVASSVRMLPPNPSPLSSSTNSLSNHRKSFPPPAKVFRAAPTWKAPDEMIGVSVPRKARSASTKRSHECWAGGSGGGGGGVVGGEQIHRQASTSPVRHTGLVSMAAASPAPASPSSSNASVRKKMKPNGPKLRPPKSTTKSSSSAAQDEIEIEIAEVLYGMLRQPQGLSKQESFTNDSREANKSSTDAKSRVSSPISNSTSTLPHSSSLLPQNSSSSVTPISTVATAPKRKKPRPVKYDDENPTIFTGRNSPISATTKAEMDQSAKMETSEKNAGSAAENGGVSYELGSSQVVQPPSLEVAQPESSMIIKPETNVLSDSKALTNESENKDVGVSKEEPQSPKKEAPVVRLDDNRDDAKANKANSTTTEVESHKEEKFQIDLMAPPPLRSSPERDGETEFVAVDPKAMVTDVEMEIKPQVKEDEKVVKTIGKEETVNVESEKPKIVAVEEAESHKPVVAPKERNIDLQLDLEKTDRDSGTASVSGNNKSHFHHNVQKLQQQQQQQSQHTHNEKIAQTSSLPLPMSVPGWPGGLPPMGYMAPLQGVVSMDGSTVSPAPIQPPNLLFTQPRPKRCATHCYIARNILYHQQIARMNPFWPAAAGSASIYGAKPGNLNVVPSAELHGNIAGRVVNPAQDKGQSLAMFPAHSGGKDNKGSQAPNIVDAAQRKQILLQQTVPQGAPNNIMGPTFIFPLSQQQAVAAASVRSGSVKPPATGSAASSSTSNSAAVSAAATAAAAAAPAPAMSFNYANIPGNETPYLAILPNSPYPFPIPGHVGAPAYRATHGQAMPFFNSFYPSQMIHPSQIHQQQQQQQQPPAQSQQSQQQGYQNASISSGSSSSQKHLQNQQQRQHGNGVNVSSGNLQGFPAPKNQPSQSLQRQQQQQNQQVPHQARQLESEMGGEDSPSTADSRVSRANMSFYAPPNFAMPIHPSNFAVMAPAAMGGASGTNNASGSHNEKKQQQQQQSHQQGLKAGVEPQAFAMSFASINGTNTGPSIDISTMNHPILSLPEVARQSYQYIAAAQATQQKRNYRVSEEGKTGGDSSNVEEERKAMPGKGQSIVGQSIAFSSRPDLTDTSVTTITGNSVVDSSARTLNLGSATARASGSVMPTSISSVTASHQLMNQRNPQQQQQQQQQQMILMQKQNQIAQNQIAQNQAVAAARSKTPATSNGSVYSDHLPSSSMGTKFANNNALSSFPQNLVQTSCSPTQSPQWKNSLRTTTSQVPSPSLSSSTSSSLKNHSQQQGRTQQSHGQISFAANTKSSTAQGQQPPSSNQSPSPPIMVGSPTTSMSKSAGGSPRTTASTSTANKAGQGSTLSSQQGKNSPSVPSRKSSPVGGRNAASILGNHHITSNSSTSSKSQLPQQQQQQQQLLPQQLSKQSIPIPNQMYFNYLQQAQVAQSTNNTSSASTTSGYFHQRNRREQQQHQSNVSLGTSSTGMLSLCPPVTLANTSTTDPAKVVAANSNMKGGISSQILQVGPYGVAQSSGNPHQLVPAGFPYVHAVPTSVQVKPAEQKQPAGE